MGITPTSPAIQALMPAATADTSPHQQHLGLAEPLPAAITNTSDGSYDFFKGFGALNDCAFDPSPLLSSKPFQRLLSLEPQVSPFEVFGIESSELVHSRVLGKLLASKGSLGFGEILMPRLATALRSVENKEPPSASLLSKLVASRFRVRLEHPCQLGNPEKDQLGRMDLLLEDDAQQLVVVIENKIWAGEQDRQVDRYRDWLVSKRPKCTAMVIYLTPKGNEPSKNSYERDRPDLPPCFCLGWNDVYKALEGLDTMDESGTVKAFQLNIQRHIMGDSVEKRLVRELMANPDLARIMRSIVANMPRIADIQKFIEDGVKDIVKEEIEVEVNSSRARDLRQIKIYVASWRKAGIPICFVFYQGDEWPTFRVMVLPDQLKRFRENFRRLHEMSPSVIHESCPTREDWSEWCIVMADDRADSSGWEGTYVEDSSYSHATAIKMLEMFNERFQTLKQAMDAFLANSSKQLV